MAGQPWLHELVTVVGAPTVVLSEPGGQVRPDGAQGVLHADTRVLSQAVLEVAGTEPVPVGGGLLGAGTALFLSVPRNLGDGGADPAVRLERRREVTAGRVRERIRLISASGSALGAPVALRVAADLAGIGDIKSGRAGEPARIEITRPARPGAGAGVPGRPGAAAGTGAARDAAARYAAARAMPGLGGGGGSSPRAGTARLAWGKGPVRVRLAAPGATALPGGPDEVVLRWQVRLPARGETEIGWELTVTDPDAVVTAEPQPGRGRVGRAGTAAGRGGTPAGPAGE
ncbi:MAG: hypothetical protein J2P35_16050, partial [Actinobacteria bacterium]|nr:hypothetical protein [Actinomycetota bacterium]